MPLNQSFSIGPFGLKKTFLFFGYGCNKYYYIGLFMRAQKVIYINEHNGLQAITYRSGVQLCNNHIFYSYSSSESQCLVFYRHCFCSLIIVKI